MKKIGIILSIISVLFCNSLYGISDSKAKLTKSVDSLLSVLDQTIAKKEVYTQIRQNKIDSLKREFIGMQDIEAKLKTAQVIFNLYFDYQNDDAKEFLIVMREVAEKYRKVNPDYLYMTDINQARLLRYTGQLKESTELLDKISKHELSPFIHYLYVSERLVNYTFLRDNSPTSEYKDYYDKMAEIYRDSVFIHSDKRMSIIVKAERLLKQNSPQAALIMLHEEYDNLDPLSRRAGTLSYNIALCHEALGDIENSKCYLALSSIADLRNGVRGYKSLQHLAILMYNTEDIDRAYNYMKCSIEDAIKSNARIRAQEASEMFVVIDDLYQQKVQRQQQTILNYLTFIGISVVLLLISLCVIAFQYKKLAAVKLKLSDANLIKEGYLGVFIEEYSNYLSRLNSYRLKSMKILKQGNLEEIERFVEEALNTTDDLKELHSKFDATILHIFPFFIEEFDMLMIDGCSNDKRNDKTELTSEQRIAAFIRLGINETDKIAMFLRYSVRTVYNYRSQMRSKAKNPDTLEKDIMQIGLSHNK